MARIVGIVDVFNFGFPGGGGVQDGGQQDLQQHQLQKQFTLVTVEISKEPEEDAEPPARTQSQTAGGGRRAPRKDAEPNNQRRTQSPLARTQSLF